MTVNTERRTQSRRRPLSLVYIELPPGNGGMMRDLSEQGFSLRAMMPLRQSEKVPFSFSLDTSGHIDGEAIVVRLEEDGRLAALEFAGLSSHSRELIRRWLEKFDELTPREPLPPNQEKAPASTFDQLRAELRTAAPRPALPSKESLSGELTPFLRLSSVRPEAAIEPDVPEIIPEVNAEPLDEPGAALLEPIPEGQLVQAGVAPQPSLEPIGGKSLRRDPPPALEPLSAFEGETDATSPGWMDRFTFGRALSIMLLLMMFAVSYVYHREVGQALIWLGQKIVGNDSPEVSQNIQPSIPTPPSAAPIIAENSPTLPNTTELKPNPSSTPANEPKGVELPRSAENPPAPQLKDSNPGSLVSAVQVDRASTPSAAAESSGDYGQQEYQQAMQILRAPNREAETPEAVRLLWIAVEKGNTSGEVALAELYRRGRGVVKNCDQARILLSAASRKGSADAQKHLEELQREGCTE